MILPEPRGDRGRQRLIATTGSVVLLVGLYGGLRGMPLPGLGSSSASVRELDPLFLERYAAPPPPDVVESPGEAPSEPANTSVGLDQEVGSAIDELSRLFEPDQSELAANGRSNGAVRPDVASGIESDVDDSRFTELFGASSEPVVVSAPRSRASVPRVGAGSAGIELGPRQRPTRAEVTAAADDAVEIAVEAPARRAAGEGSATDVVIKEYEPETFNRFEADVLAEWMAANPAELPVGVRVHLNYMPSFRTAAAPFVSDGRELELYLMYNASLRELHIVLVEGEHSVYLIDRGFQEQSRSLREGTVRRLDGEIVAVNSQAGAASSDEAREFYNIFLSWWEVAKADVR